MIIPLDILGANHDNVAVVNVVLSTVSDLGAGGTRKTFEKQKYNDEHT